MGTDRNVSDEEIATACKEANCHSFIFQLPDGYKTLVGEHGGMLFGGQKQRIAIARVLIHKPRVLGASALDSDSEKLVQEALDNILEEGGHTAIIIAHHLSTIQNTDLICVVKVGHVIEQDMHWELLSWDGAYADLVKELSLSVL